MAKNQKKDPGFFKRFWAVRNLYIFFVPYMLLFLLFTVVPVAMSIGLSFTSFNVLQPPTIVYFDNYIRLFANDSVFTKALLNTLVLAVVAGPGGFLISYVFAWFINELSPKLRGIMTLVFYAPSIAGNAYLIWSLLFSGDANGYINAWLIRFGFITDPIQFMSNETYMMPILISVILWTSLGTGFLSFVAGFQGIDRTMYEAGAVEGIRNRWQELWYITLPTMRPQLMFGAVMSITGAFGIGSVVTGLFGFPSQNYALHTIATHLEDYGSIRFEMGYASAIATVLFLLTIGCNSLISRLLSKVGE